MNAFRKLLFVVASVASLGTVGCTSVPPSPPSDVGPTYVAPSGTGARTIDGVEYEYVASAERKAQIIAGFPKLKVGQSREEVRSVLGLPDWARIGQGKAPHAPFLGWFYLYKIKVLSGGANEVCVEVFFHPTGEMKWAVPNHVAGLKEVGSPAHR